MKHRLIRIIPVTVLMFIFATPVGSRAQTSVDHSLFGKLLASHVTHGAVDYKGFQKDEIQLDRYLAQLGSISPQELSPPEQMAFYINLYNAWTIKLILTRYPHIASIKETGGLFSSPWDKKIVVLDHTKVSLDHIEHDILRPQFKDPRIHFAVNCASKSCPPLLGEPYTGHGLETQLDQVTTAFINDPKSNYIRDDTLYVSSIFKWYSQDFIEGIPAFFQKYAHNGLKNKLMALSSELKISYLDYDWSLNGS